jgi:hypothetical protein
VNVYPRVRSGSLSQSHRALSIVHKLPKVSHGVTGAEGREKGPVPLRFDAATATV